MAVPAISSVNPVTGLTAGGDVVRITGSDFAAQIVVLFDDVKAVVLSVREEAGVSLADVHTPTHAEESVDIALRNLDAAGNPVPGKDVVLPGAYRFLRPRIVHESDLTRLVCGLLRDLKQKIIANVSMTVSVDYDDDTIDGLNVLAISRLPRLCCPVRRSTRTDSFPPTSPTKTWSPV